MVKGSPYKGELKGNQPYGEGTMEMFNEPDEDHDEPQDYVMKGTFKNSRFHGLCKHVTFTHNFNCSAHMTFKDNDGVYICQHKDDVVLGKATV